MIFAFFGFWDRDIYILYCINLPSFQILMTHVTKIIFSLIFAIVHVYLCMKTRAFGFMWNHIRVHMGNWGRCQWLFSINYFYIEARFLLNLKLAIWSSLVHTLDLWVTSLHFQCLGITGGLAHSHGCYLIPGDRDSDPLHCRKSVFINYLRFSHCALITFTSLFFCCCSFVLF